MKGTNTIFRLIITTLAVFLFTFSISIAFLILGSQKIFATDASSINIPNTYMDTAAPEGMVALPDGHVWYAESLNNHLTLADPVTNTILRTVGRTGTDEGEFEGLMSVTRDNNGNLYALSIDGTVTKMDSNGGFLARYYTLVGGEARDIEYDSYTDTFLVMSYQGNRIERFDNDFNNVSGFGVEGTGEGEFDRITGLTVGTDGKIYASDNRNERVQIFDSNYNYLFEIKNWTDGNFVNVHDVVVQSNGNINVISLDTQSVVQFTSSGVYIRNFGNGEFAAPFYITKDSSDNLYISDMVRSAIFKYNSTGVLQNIFGNALNIPGKFIQPNAVKYNSSGHAFVLDSTGRVQEFNSDGSYIDTIIPVDQVGGDASFMKFAPDGKIVITNNNGFKVFQLNEGLWSLFLDYDHRGAGTGEFNYATGLAFDSSGNLFVCDRYNHRIQKFNSSYVWDSTIDNGHSDPLTDGQLDNPQGIAIDATDNLYVASFHSVLKLSSVGEYLGKVGEGDFVSPGFVNIMNGIIYISDSNSDSSGRVRSYSVADGTLLETIGNYGSGQMQYRFPWDTAINPVSGLLSIVDPLNNRVITMSEGNRILNLISSADVISLDSGVSNGQSLSNQTWNSGNFSDISAIPARLMFGDYVVADFTVDLTVDRDWVTVNVQTLPWDSKSLVVNLNQTDAPGISAEHSLYITRYSNQTSATVCPNAVILSGVAEGCSGEYTLHEGDSGLTAVTIDGKNYWKIDNLTGTGAFSSLFETGFELSDVMTRQQVSTASNHEITFGTSYDINHSGDTITLTFSTDWDLSTIHLGDGDLSLYRGATALTLGASDNTDIWGVTVDNGLKHIVFTAPTNVDTSDQSISAGSVIKVFINNESLINPNAVEMYDINIQIITNSETNNENGSISVPIVDSDTVNIEGFVTSDLYFDLDTGTGETPAGGESPTYVNCDYDACPAYETGPVADNYTVDLGHLNMTNVNKSNFESVLHSDSGEGLINSIYFDLSTNSASGVVLTYKSLYGELRGPAHSITAADDLDIPTTNGSVDIEYGVSAYGIQLAVDPVYKSVGTGTQTVNCSTDSTYCIMGDINPTTGVNEQTAEPLYTVTGPIELGRGKIDVAAAIDGTVVPGNYEDFITFIATAIF